MDMQNSGARNERPGTVLAVGIALLAVCAVFAFLWFTSDFLFARPLGLLTGSAGIYFAYSGVVGLREERG